MTNEVAELVAGRELSALVAEKVMGLTRGVDFGVVAEHQWRSTWDIDDNPSSVFYCRRCWTYADIEAEGPCQEEPTPYSAMIGYAWEVVEQMQSQGWTMNLNVEARDLRAPFDCRFFHQDGRRAMQVERSAPMAICRAALKAVAG